MKKSDYMIYCPKEERQTPHLYCGRHAMRFCQNCYGDNCPYFGHPLPNPKVVKKQLTIEHEIDNSGHEAS